jgi:hypothetical protein
MNIKESQNHCKRKEDKDCNKAKESETDVRTRIQKIATKYQKQ